MKFLSLHFFLQTVHDTPEKVVYLRYQTLNKEKDFIMAIETIYKTVNDKGEYSCGNIGISTKEWFNSEAKQLWEI